MSMKRFVRAPAKRFVAMTLAAATIFTAGITSETITSFAAEPSQAETFVPFRSYYIGYLSEHSAESSDENIYLWCKMLGEQLSGTTNAAANNWFSTYHAEVVLPGGTYLSDSAAASNYVYATSGVSNPIYDQMLANLITANGVTFLNKWINGYTDSNGSVLLSAADGKDTFIKFFDNEYSSFSKTAAALVELTKTSDGNAWLQNFTYAKTGSVEASVGVTILKLFCADFDDLNNTQLTWAKEYLPYLLSDYASKGSSGLAASTKNAYLYDFMARSVSGAQCTSTKASATTVSANGVSLGTVAAGTKLQQEFFNYVVASSEGFGSFVQNIIGGGKYTGAYSNSYDLSSYDTAQSVIMAPDADIDYYTSTANGGDRDTDWFNHAMYLHSAGSGYSQFATVYNLMKANGTTFSYYNDWLSRFGSKKGVTMNWSYLSNQTSNATPNNGYGSAQQWNWCRIDQYNWNNGNNTGNINDGDPAQLILINYSSTLATTWRVRYESWSGKPDSVKGDQYNWTWYTPLTQDVSNANKFTVRFSATLKGMTVKVQILENSKTGAAVTEGSVYVPANGSNSITLTVDGKADSYYLRVIPTGINELWSYYGSGAQPTFSITNVTVSFASTSPCLNGHNYSDWQMDYSSDSTSVSLYHTCSNCGVEEREALSLSNGKVTKSETDTQITYTYKPTVLTNKGTWTKTISKDVGSGTTTFVSGSSGTSGNWQVSNTSVTHSQFHRQSGSTSIAVSTTTACATGTVVINPGTIKQNVQKITAYVGSIGETTEGRELAVTVYDAKGRMLRSETVINGSCAIDLSNYANSVKDGLYVQISHKNTVTKENARAGKWDDYPSYPSATATSVVSRVVVTY